MKLINKLFELIKPKGQKIVYVPVETFTTTPDWAYKMAPVSYKKDEGEVKCENSTQHA